MGAWWEELNKIDPERAPKPKADSLDELLFESGHKHEAELIKDLEVNGKNVKKLSGKMSVDAFEETIEAMSEGFDFIHQASLQNEELRGSADLLERINKPSKLGPWSYIPIECKLSSHSKPIYLVQACAYCELLDPILGSRPNNFKLYLGGKKFEKGIEGYRVDDFWMWYRRLRERYRKFLEDFDPNNQPEHSPGDHGHWTTFIEEELGKKRDLILVAGMRQSQRKKLIAGGISTIDQLASAPADQQIKRLDEKTFVRLKEQAAIQVAPAQSDGRPPFIVRALDEQEKGLAILPQPDRGDVWFDMEGYPNPLTGEKLEYLFGACYLDEHGHRQYESWWAHDSIQEKQAFNDFIVWVENRRLTYEDLHVYHYASYEKTAIGRLAATHGIHKTLWDQWLREELFVDLYPVVRNGLLIGEPSYSIKKVERLYSDLEDLRNEEISTAADSVVQYAEWQKSNEPKWIGSSISLSKRLQDLEDYNKKDCESTEELHKFLIEQHDYLKLSFRPNKWGDLQEEAQTDFERELEIAAKAIIEEIPEPLIDSSEKGPYDLSYRLQKLVADLIDFHERERKVEWWEFFNRSNIMTSNERYEDTEVIAQAEKIDERPIKRSQGHVYRFSDDQPEKLSGKSENEIAFALAPLSKKDNKLVPLEILRTNDGWPLYLMGEFDENDQATIILKTSDHKQQVLNDLGIHALPEFCELIPKPKQIFRHMLPDLLRQAQGWINKSRSLPPAMIHLLEKRRIPELIPLNQIIRKAPEETVSVLTDFFLKADGLSLSLQGPPGTGKTTLTAELIVRLIDNGLRIAVSSNTHLAINNLLMRVQIKAESTNINPFIVKLSSSKSLKSDRRFLSGTSIPAIRNNDLEGEPNVLGANVFSLVKENFNQEPFDLLVVDEAGQVSLSNLLYMSQCARNILLVGDQNQLSQPYRAEHPGESGLSCLDFVMADEKVVPSDRGIFLATSWRMPPQLTSVVSDLFYQGQLQPCIAKSENKIIWEGIQQGLRFEPVEHFYNGSSSQEEIDRIEQLVNQLLGCSYQLVQQDGESSSVVKRVISHQDILITAPYNVQVNRLRRRLSDRARIGTVDNFQGQEAPISIHSLTASDGENAPRGIGFVLDQDRLNVAISRAQCLSIVVGSPNLATEIISTVEGVTQINRLCRIMETAKM